MKVNHQFASKVARMAAEMVADGWPHGTFENPDWLLEPGASVETALMRAGYEVWGGQGWWRRSIPKAESCLQSIRRTVLDDLDGQVPTRDGRGALARWDDLSADETVVMLLFASHWLKSEPSAKEKAPQVRPAT